MNKDNGTHEPDDSQAFLVRLWPVEVESEDERGNMESRGIKVQGKVTHLLSGRGSNFNDEATLMSLLIGMLPTTSNDHNSEEEKGV